MILKQAKEQIPSTKYSFAKTALKKLDIKPRPKKGGNTYAQTQ